jgi:hypothetical protein
MDTRYWGPSGWQLFHLVSFRSKNPDEILIQMKDVLPCRFCRESTTEFVRKHPLRGDPAKWLYEIHNMVNDKLRTQCKDDPNVINPGENPSFESVKEHYMKLKPTEIPGRDFLFSIAINYPDKPEEIDMATQRVFIEKLSTEFPFHSFESYLKRNPVDLQSKKRYTKWMYGLLKFLAPKFHTTLPSYKGYVMRVMYYKSGCSKKTYRGKTCRKTSSGHYTKARDNQKTQRVSHASLLRF